MEPMAGIEPATDGLRNRCSTTELHWLNHFQTVTSKKRQDRPGRFWIIQSASHGHPKTTIEEGPNAKSLYAHAWLRSSKVCNWGMLDRLQTGAAKGSNQNNFAHSLLDS